MSDTMQGIDISVYQGEPPISWWRQLRSEGWEVAVVGSWHGRSRNQYAETNLSAARREGFYTATYVLLMDGRTGAEQVQLGREACGAEWDNLNFVAVDCEHKGATIPRIAEAAQEVLRLERRPAIYTARWWWVGEFGNPQDFRRLPLWNAYYDRDPDIDFASAPYGGWTEAVGEQYEGTVDLHGVDVDKNTFRADFIEEEDMAAIEELRTALAKTNELLATVGQRNAAAGIWGQLEALALRGEKPPEALKQQARYLLR